MTNNLKELTTQELKMLQAFSRDRLRSLNKERYELEKRVEEIEILLKGE